MTARVHVRSTWGRLATACVLCTAMFAGFRMMLSNPASNQAQDRVPSKESAIARLEGLGGFVGIDGELPGEPVWKVELNELPVTADLLHVLKAFPQLEVLSLDDTPLTDALLIQVGELKSLKELSLADTRITDAGLSHLKRLSALQQLVLHGTKVTDAGLTQLATLKNLKVILCVDTAITDAGLVAFRQAQQAQPSPPVKSPAEPPAQAAPGNSPLQQVQLPLADSLHQLGRALFPAAGRDPGRQQQAVAVLEQAYAADPEDELIRLDLADAYVQLGTGISLTLAIDLYEQALQQHQGDDALLARLADTYGRLGNADAAFAIAAVRARLSQGDPFSAAYQIADFAAETGDVERGIAELQAVAHAHPESAATKMLLATLLLETSQVSAANQLIDEVLKSLPSEAPLAIVARRLQEGGNR
ncbi:MAG: tetratricopeptide repeat protein [Planctomycetaceae bacterium]|nr:tetratricopeptide repeat protein [Planctomycetaceae bacterium]